MPTKDVERIVYYESYVVVQPGNTGLLQRDLLTEDQYLDVFDGLSKEEREMDEDNPNKFIAGIGAEAIKELLKRVDVEELYYDLKKVLKEETSQQKKAELLKRLRILNAFTHREDTTIENRPEWMVSTLCRLLRRTAPLIPLEGRTVRTSDLNDLFAA